MQPEACALAGVLAEVVGLDRLRRLADVRRDDRHRVLQIPRHVTGERDALTDEGQRGVRALPAAPAVVPVDSGDREICAVAVEAEAVPLARAHRFAAVALDVVGRAIVGGLEVATPGIDSAGAQGFADHAGAFAVHQKRRRRTSGCTQ